MGRGAAAQVAALRAIAYARRTLSRWRERGRTCPKNPLPLAGEGRVRVGATRGRLGVAARTTFTPTLSRGEREILAGSVHMRLPLGSLQLGRLLGPAAAADFD